MRDYTCKAQRSCSRISTGPFHSAFCGALRTFVNGDPKSHAKWRVALVGTMIENGLLAKHHEKLIERCV